MVNFRKVILVVGVLLIVNTSYAANNKEKIKGCEKILAAGMFNGLLEDICGFEGNVKANLLKMYDKAECRKIIPQATVDQLSKDVVLDTKKELMHIVHIHFVRKTCSHMLT
ncbi:hypothetical protein NQU59_11590 [Acinetobacter colistiniresistens]|uniref:hypothetical protein n=1 Tax=Acinetobacter colistiniresistens TaxID=280145 RepID=UPI00211B7FE0|nr:hypothetical protein [Acinetobacter colistiniresistens]UUM26343.1 hypothetical protein NQU59_11590 [Acinetobacter colistiniresistens]